MTDHKNDLLREIQSALLSSFDVDMATKIVATITSTIQNYSVQKIEQTLITYDNESEMMLRNFLATKKIEGRSEKTLERYAYIIRRFTSKLGVQTKNVTVYNIRYYMAQEILRGVSTNTIAGIKQIFSSYFGWLHREGLIQHNPCAQLGGIKTEQLVKLPYSAADIEKLRTACRNLRDRALIEFLLATGCRVDEVIRLNTEDVDLVTMECKVHGKGNKERIVYINDVCKIHLKRYLDSRKKKTEALFDGKGTMRIEHDGVRVALKRLAIKAGVDHVHPHRFRRTLATNLINRGMKIQDVARILGHSKLDTTLKYVFINDLDIKNEYQKYTA